MNDNPLNNLSCPLWDKAEALAKELDFRLNLSKPRVVMLYTEYSDVRYGPFTSIADAHWFLLQNEQTIRDIQHTQKRDALILAIERIAPDPDPGVEYWLEVVDEYGERIFADFYTNYKTLELSLQQQYEENKNKQVYFIIKRF